MYGYRRNMEYYPDPTASDVMENIESEERFHKLLHVIFDLCELSGFHLEGRITLLDKRTGKIWS